MADNRSKGQVLEGHAEHVRQNGHSTFKVYQPSVSSPAEATPIGSLFLEVCTECPFMRVTCNHEKNEWNSDGTVLSCKLCGIDGT